MVPRNRPMLLRSGGVVQSGLDPHHRERPRRRLDGIFRAVVLATYVTDEEGSIRKFGVECDVILVASLAVLRHVPVKQAHHGINNVHDLWVPKPTTQTLSGAPLNLTVYSARGMYQGPPSPIDDLNGDTVLVEFVEGKARFPIITGAMTHESTKRRVIAGSGWVDGDASSRGAPHKDEFYTCHQGTEIRINANGDVLIDTVGAHADPVNEDPTTGAGQVRLRLKESQRFTVEMDGEDVLEVWQDGSGVHIDLGEGATEHLQKGETLNRWLLAHTHPDGFGGTSPPAATTLTGEVLTDALSTQHRVK